MDKPKVTPKDFFLWAGAMITLYWSIFAFIALIFSYINYAMPDALSYYASDPYSAGISYQMASLIVFFPIFIWISRVIRKSIIADATRAEIWVRRWALYLTLFLAAITLAIDLVTLVMYFFNGDVTLRFVLKVLVVFLVAGGGFLHFLADLKGYWQQNTAKARLVGWATAALLVVTIVAGFFIVGTPWQARLYRFDDQKVSDLQGIQSQIVTWWQAKQKLPGTLADLNNSLSGYQVPTDPQSGDAYEYIPGEGLSFQLCATFNAPTQPYGQQGRAVVTYPTPAGIEGYKTNDVWQHDAGRTCFERTIDPALYPPLK